MRGCVRTYGTTESTMKKVGCAASRGSSTK